MSNFKCKAPQSPGSSELFRRLLRPCVVVACRRVCREQCRFFPGALRAPVDERRGCPANSGYPQPRSFRFTSLAACSDLSLVERTRLDQSKYPRTAIETEFDERVAGGHGIKAPLPFEHDLHCGQRTVFFD